MALFNEADIQRVLQATDIVEVVGSYVALRPRGKEMVGLCPFHEDARPSLNVSASKQIFKCFACGAGGSAITFIMRRERLSFPEAVRLLAQRAGIALEERVEGKGSADRYDLEKVNRWAARFFRRMYEEEQEGARARQYVAGRGISEETARRFGLGWAPARWESLRTAAEKEGQRAGELVRLGLLVERQQGGGYYDRFRERLVFPVIDALGRVIGFGGRTLGDDPAKYLNSPESELFDKSQALYGIHAAKDAIVRSRTAVVVEGYTDCVMAQQYGVGNVVATLGTALTAEHARVLSRYADRIVLMFDSDEAGRKAAARAIEIFLGQRVEVRLAGLPEGLDPCDFLRARGREAFEAVVEQATDALEYKWQGTLRALEQADTVNGRRRATEEFLEFVGEAFSAHHIDAISQGFLENHVAKLVGASASEVREQVRRGQRRRVSRGAAGGSGAPAETGAEGQGARGGDSVARAEQEVLEVLLNRPELGATVREVLAGPGDFRDEIHRAIAERLWGGEGPEGTRSLSEVLGGVESVRLCEIITDLAERGAARGNYEETLAGALRHLEHHRLEEAREGVRQLIATASEKYGEDAETAALLEYQAQWQPDPRRAPKRR